MGLQQSPPAVHFVARKIELLEGHTRRHHPRDFKQNYRVDIRHSWYTLGLFDPVTYIRSQKNSTYSQPLVNHQPFTTGWINHPYIYPKWLVICHQISATQHSTQPSNHSATRAPPSAGRQGFNGARGVQGRRPCPMLDKYSVHVRTQMIT